MLIRLIPLAVIVSLLCGCGPRTRWDHTPREEHIVRGGETLFAIAWRYGRDPEALARWNNIDDASMIFPGQVIRLNPPAGGVASGPPPQRGKQPLPSV